MMQKVVDILEDFYDRMYSSYEKWLAVPIIMLVLAFSVIGYSYISTGELVSKGIEFTGGTETQLSVPSSISEEEIRTAFSQRYEEVNVRTLSQGEETIFLIKTGERPDRVGGSEITGSEENLKDINTTEIVEETLNANNIPYSDIGVQTIGSAVSKSFLFEAQIAVLFSFLVMASVIFIAFRSLVPSLAVILAAFLDIVVAVAGMNVLGINLTLGSLAALLMLIGYSVDTDIVLSTRILRQRKGTLKERVKDSITTGITMTAGAIVAFTVLFLVSTSPTLDQIAAVILIGLLADIPATWTGNAIILKMHSEGKI
ncbi:MAG: protein translocase subunit SecF [Candidatus Nanohaloarchaea archaeon]|nr:protein translocase subunit SecF [Candidatus Nanohaloarchaea archaeon]